MGLGLDHPNPRMLLLLVHQVCLLADNSMCYAAALQDLIQQLQPGQGVIFCREPSNPADQHAVGVHTAGMQHLGYLPKYAAQKWQLQVCGTVFMSVLGLLIQLLASACAWSCHQLHKHLLSVYLTLPSL
jgi:hypothetical protein